MVSSSLVGSERLVDPAVVNLSSSVYLVIPFRSTPDFTLTGILDGKLPEGIKEISADY